MIGLPQVWRLPRENNDWIGPIDSTVTADGSPIDVSTMKFALISRLDEDGAESGARPTDGDWADPIANPDDTVGGFGLHVDPVDERSQYGVWVKVSVGGTVEVFEPHTVGWLSRT